MKWPSRGEVWLVDLGMAAKVRPCLILSVPPSDSDRALVTLVPHTTSLRGSRFEAPLPVRFLHQGGFDAQGLVTVPHVKLLRLLGKLSASHLSTVGFHVCAWLGLSPSSKQAAV
jgi:mRNA interferase MazF